MLHREVADIDFHEIKYPLTVLHNWWVLSDKIPNCLHMFYRQKCIKRTTGPNLSSDFRTIMWFVQYVHVSSGNMLLYRMLDKFILYQAEINTVILYSIMSWNRISSKDKSHH